MKTQKKQIQKIVQGIVIHKRGTILGETQREEFRRRWGIRPEGLDYGRVILKAS